MNNLLKIIMKKSYNLSKIKIIIFQIQFIVIYISLKIKIQ